MPSRASTRAVALVDPAQGLGYSGAVIGQAQPERLGVTVTGRTEAVSGASQSAGLLDKQNDPNLGLNALRDRSAGSTQPQIASSLVATPGPAPAAAPAALPCDLSQSKLYCVYTVQKGDTLGEIALKFGLKGNREEDVAPYELLVHSNKPDIVSEDDLLQIGQKLRIPVQNDTIHTVLSTQTLSDIAAVYDVAAADILAVTTNGIADPDALAIGQELIVPNPTRFAKPLPPPAPSAPSISSGSTAVSGPRSSLGFMWPTTGRISSYFGPGHPLGIDVDLFGSPNAPIGAAKAGAVTFAGGNVCCSYGLYVVVDHGGGYQTLYAHLSQISVGVGQRVSQGQVVGYGGRTGYATGNHLHFEVHYQGNVINPMAVLP